MTNQEFQEILDDLEQGMTPEEIYAEMEKRRRD